MLSRTKTKKKCTPKHFTPEHQRHARSKVSSESCSRNGAKGAKATRAKYGEEFLFERWHAWKLANPSRPEQSVIGILTQLGIEFEREKRLGNSLYTVDFYLLATGHAIEVDSRIHTRLDAEKRKRQAATKRKLLKQQGIECLTVWDKELCAGDLTPVARKIKDFIAQVQRSEENGYAR